MRIIAAALVALGILALPVTVDAHRYYHHHHHYGGPSVMVSPGFFGLYVGPSYGYHRYYYRDYYRDRYWGGPYYGNYRYWHRPYWRDRYYDPWY
ncbi:MULTISPECIES: hypothetical protein [Rhizobium]|uniref:Uncharacterized protein n=1 Tax=Rhizobium paranaense TaxID=1650438 RepID=A0A7W9D2P1_9HYPH|nr:MULTISPECIES: hypothetical protein [Rhizobium]MBB5575076.1 hypothetical protein [Rhizobium paranaense]PST64488.1 hypothetical protein C9E91_03120 [Rhizobium sp. SEMIA4064]